MKILIVDDEKPALDRLTRMIESLPDYQLVATANNGKQALTMAVSTEPDIVLMDIRMPEMDGIQAAYHLAQMTPPPAVIFTTAYSDHALEAFETHAVDYLLKPVKKERLQSAIESARKLNKAQESKTTQMLKSIEPRQHICARVRDNLVLVAIDDIYYFNADHKYVTVRYSQGEVLIEDTLKALEAEFGDRFYRIHRNALVNLLKISGLNATNDGYQVKFAGINNTLEVSRRHLSGIRKIIKKL